MPGILRVLRGYCDGIAAQRIVEVKSKLDKATAATGFIMGLRLEKS